MGKTIIEKILGSHSGKSVSAGELVVADVDLMMGHDFNGAMTIDVFKKLGRTRLAKPDNSIFVFDHAVPSPNEDYARMQQIIYKFAAEQGMKIYDVGEGICHQVIPEKGHVLPGSIVVGSDSHTCSYGALGALSTGVGSTDLAIALSTGKLWFKVPETIRVNFSGKLPLGVYAKDLALYTVKEFTADGASYLAMEFHGEPIRELSVDGRLTLCNMGIEMGAKTATIEADDKTAEWLRSRTNKDYAPVLADYDANYQIVKNIDVSSLVPQIALPHQVDNVVPITSVKNVPVHSLLLGTCTNGRLEDLRIAASILKNKVVKKGVHLYVTPASRQILLEAIKEGLIEIFLNAGAVIEPPSCGPCGGACGGIPGDGENMLSTANRNFKGRAGNPKSFVYLGSPATIAASAITGVITDPRDFL